MGNHWHLALALLAAFGPGCQCHCDGQPDPGAPDSVAQEAGLPDAALPDAGPDAADGSRTWKLDAWVERDACDATQIELPPTENSDVLQVTNMGRWVAYDEMHYPEKHNIYLYDLATCDVHLLSSTDRNQYNPFIWGENIVYTDIIDSYGPWELVSFNIPTLTFTQLTSGEEAGWPYANSRYIIYRTKLGLEFSEGTYLMLWDRQTDLKVQLASNTQAAEGMSISETHAAWVAYGGPAKDVFYVDLATQEVTHVESTWDPWTAFTSTWGDWVVWEDTRSGLDIWGLRLGTGEEVQLTDNGASNARPTLRGDVLCFRTTLWSGTWPQWDLAVMDLTTGVVRKVTQTTAEYKCGFADSGWLVYQQQIRPGSWTNNKIFATNLLKRGILDAQGHVVPSP
jgi:Tol biopolymer transport system component